MNEWTMYTLTHLTGRKASEQRIITWIGIDGGPRAWKRFWIVLASSVCVFFILYWVIGAYAIIPTLVFALAAFILINKRVGRSQEQMWLKARRDAMRSDVGAFYVGGRQVNPLAAPVYRFVQNTIPTRIEEDQ